jgi:hypothetical protein
MVERLHGRVRNRHVVNGPEILLATVEIRRHRKAVAEITVIDEVAGTADMEHNRNACFLGAGPNRVELDVAR